MGVPGERVMSAGGPQRLVPCLVGGAGFDGCVFWEERDGRGAAERSAS